MDLWLGLDVLVRWIHIVAAILLAGGTIFMRFALHPGLAELPDHERQPVRDLVLKRWKTFVHLAIALVLVSGLYNFWSRFAEVKPMPYHLLFGLKLLIAAVVFVIASALVGRAKGFQAIRSRPKFYLNLNAALALILVLLGGLMRVAPEKPKPDAQPSAAVVRPVATSNSASIGTSIAAVAKP
jgi:uncharacterized membrane protein